MMMISALISNEYFWLSFLPIATLSIGFWLLFFDRTDETKEPLILLFLALLAGIFSALVFWQLAQLISLENFVLKVLGEELIKTLFAILMMEILKKRFHHLADGVIYGFAVGLGFAFVENVFHLYSQYVASGFSPDFWLNFQGRFWSTTLLHGITTAIFGLFYAGAYLSDTLHKGRKESPLRLFFLPPDYYQFLQIITFHVSRHHLLIKNEKSLKGHFSRAVLMEGFLVAFFLHLVFNLALYYTFNGLAFFIALFGAWFLNWKVKNR